MQIKIKCSCGGKFSVDDKHVNSDAEVSIRFCCPYCGKNYGIGDDVAICGTSGGVSITGNATIKGDIVGRDSYR